MRVDVQVQEEAALDRSLIDEAQQQRSRRLDEAEAAAAAAAVQEEAENWENAAKSGHPARRKRGGGEVQVQEEEGEENLAYSDNFARARGEFEATADARTAMRAELRNSFRDMMVEARNAGGPPERPQKTHRRR